MAHVARQVVASLLVDALVTCLAVLVAGSIMVPSLASTAMRKDLSHVLLGLGHSISGYASAHPPRGTSLRMRSLDQFRERTGREPSLVSGGGAAVAEGLLCLLTSVYPSAQSDFVHIEVLRCRWKMGDNTGPHSPCVL